MEQQELDKEDQIAHLTGRASDLVLPGIRSKHSAILDPELNANHSKLNLEGKYHAFIKRFDE